MKKDRYLHYVQKSHKHKVERNNKDNKGLKLKTQFNKWKH